MLILHTLRLKHKTPLLSYALRVILSVLVVSTFLTSQDEIVANENSTHYSVLVLAGQSNAQGDTSFVSSMNPPLGSHPADSATKIMWSTGDDQLTVTRFNSSSTELLPLTSVQPKNYFGPEIGIARNLWDQGRRNMVFLKVTYGLQRLAQTPSNEFGGLADWNVNSVGKSYDMLKQRRLDLAAIMQANGDTYSIDAFYWMQGESDAVKAETVENYQANLTELLDSVKQDLEMHPDAINILGKISGQQCLSNVYNLIYNPSGCAVSVCILAVHPCSTFEKVTQGNNNVRQAIQNIADSDPKTFVVETEDLLRGADFIHLTAASQLTLGRRMANPQFVLPYRAEDSDDYDGDGITNIEEDVNGDGNLGNDDSDGDGIPDYLDSIFGPGGGRTSISIASKTLTDENGNELEEVRPGSEMNWKFTIQNDLASPMDLLLNETISSRQQYVQDSLVTPPGYIKQFSNDGGENFSSESNLSGINAIRVSKENVPVGAKGDSAEVTQTSEIFTNSTSDNSGYLPIVHGERIFTLFTSTLAGEGPGQRKFDIGCVEKATGDNCAGYPKDFYDSQGNSDFRSPVTPLHYLDEDGRIFTSTQRNLGFGIVCFDTNTNDMCEGQEYIQLSSAGAPLGGQRQSRIQQLNKIGDCLFTYDITLKVYSYDPAIGSTPCGSHTTKDLVASYGGVVTAYTPANHTDYGSTGPIAQSIVQGTKMYIYMNYAFESNLDIFGCNFVVDICKGTRLVCFDATTGDGRCSNGDGGYFSNPRPNCYNDRFCRLTQPFINPINNSVCAFAYRPQNFTYLGINCNDLQTGTSVAITDQLNTVTTAGREAVDMANFLPTFHAAEVTLSDGDQATIFAWEKAYLIASPRSGKAVCFNWTENALCSGFGHQGAGSSRWDPWTFNGITSSEIGVTGDTNDIGYVPDNNGCVWAKGRNGDTWSFDASTGSAPCRRYTQNVTVEPSRFYCEVLSSKVDSWNEAKLVMPIGTSIEDLSELYVTIVDSQSNPVTGYEMIDLLTVAGNVTEPGILDISGISVDDYSELEASFQFKANNSLPWASENMNPLVVLTFSGDDPEICYQTVVEDACNIITPLTNSGQIQVTDQLQEVHNVGLSSTAIVQYEDGEMCIPDIRITTTGYSGKVFPGQLINYIIEVTNIASNDPLSRAQDINLTSYLPLNTSYVSSSGGTFIEDRVQWPTFNLDGFDSQVYELTIRVDEGSQGNLLLLTNAVLSDDPTPYNNIYTAYSEIGTYSLVRANAWMDENEDGIADENEIALEGIEVELLREGVVLDSVTTNESGVAEFTNVLPAEGYQLKFVTPQGFDLSPKRTGIEETIVSSIDPESQQSDVFVLSEGEIREGIFAGFYPSQISDFPVDEQREQNQAQTNLESSDFEDVDELDETNSEGQATSSNPKADSDSDDLKKNPLNINPKKLNTFLIYSVLVALNIVGLTFLVRELRKRRHMPKIES